MLNETPIMRQYRSIKDKHKDAILMFRLGDFYEMFEEDAKVAARELELTLTSKPVGGNRRVPLAGVPHHSAEGYITKLTRRGYKVAVCEQMADPSTVKGIVPREVIQVVTPGTITNAQVLDAKEPNYISAVVMGGGESGAVASAELTAGELIVASFETMTELSAELVRLNPAEILLPEEQDRLIDRVREALPRAFVNPQPAWTFDPSYGGGKICEQLRISTLEGLDLSGNESGVSALGAVIAYLRETQKTALDHLRRVSVHRFKERLQLDAQVIRNLELVQNLHDGSANATLLKVLDRTKTGMGARRLRHWLLSPLVEVKGIGARLDAVEKLTEDSLARTEIRECLGRSYDLERLAGRLGCRSAGPRDLLALVNTLDQVPPLRALVERLAGDSALLKAVCGDLRDLPELVALIRSAVVDEPPVGIKDGGIFRKGCNPELDDLHDGSKGAREWIRGLQERERKRTGINSLKVGFNKVFGYYIEVTHAHKDSIPDDYVRKQTLVNAERYITPELKEYESKVLGADDRMKELEYDLFVSLREDAARFLPQIQQTADALATLDALASFAERSVEGDYVRPQITAEGPITIKAGRHPVVEVLGVTGAFVPNDTLVDNDENRFLLITGPNMAGKSTYIRQVALITLMAQAGCFVPAREASIGVADRIFTRVGASDRLASGQSTFMVEMVETAAVLTAATPRSLVVLDEIGRGTSTYDGLSIAWAVSESIHARRARCLFATHYHELTDLEEMLPGFKNYNVAVHERGSEVVFTHHIVPGGADRSYGIHVAALAGIAPEVITRAKEILAMLEAGEVELKGRAAAEDGALQMTFFGPAPVDSKERKILDRLAQCHPDEMTPREAWELIEELKRL